MDGQQFQAPPPRPEKTLDNPEVKELLRRPFTVEQHGFVNGRPYILKDAIRLRLDEVDPVWSIGPPSLLYIAASVTLTAPMSVLGGVRWDVGSAIFIQTGKPTTAGEVTPLGANELATNEKRAFKAAMSDLLPRAALQFGVGAYLRNVPKNVVDYASLANWLGEVGKPRPGQLQQRSQSESDAIEMAFWQAVFDGTRAMWPGTTDELRRAGFKATIGEWIKAGKLTRDTSNVGATVTKIGSLLNPEERRK